MKVIVSGVIVDTSEYDSKKDKVKTSVLVLYSDGELAKVYEFPPVLFPGLYEKVDIPCRAFQGKKGLGFVYEK